jgi:hypothetical protein
MTVGTGPSFVTKEQVDEYIRYWYGPYLSQDRVQRSGLYFAKLYFQVGDYQSALRFLADLQNYFPDNAEVI